MKRMACVFISFVLLGGCTLAVFGQPINDMFANRISITGTNAVVAGSNIGATFEVNEPDHYTFGGSSVWWTWTAPAAGGGFATVRTSGSSFDTLLGVYKGASVWALTLVASNDDDPDAIDYTSAVVFETVPGQVYQIAVDGYYGKVGSIQLAVQWGLPPPPAPAPAWVLPDPYGQVIRSTNFAGKVVVLDFWATWCGPCIAEIPDLNFLQDKYRADGLVIVGASLGEEPATVQTFMQSTPLSYQVVMDNYSAAQAYGGIPYIPTTFIIGRDNLIMKKFVGTQTRSTLERQIIPLLYGNTRLQVARTNANPFVLRWRTNAVNFVLESASPQQNMVWTTWPTVPTVVNGTNTVQVPVTTSTNRFFRLRLPY